MNAGTDDLLGRIFDFIGDPIFVKDRTHRLCLVNEAMCIALGRTREKLIGLGDDDLFGKDEAEFFRSRDEKVFLTGEEDLVEETFTPHGSSETLTVLTRKRLYVDPQGKSFIVGVFKDITAIKRAEAALQKANETLEENVRERTAELSRANADLSMHVEDLRRLNLALEEKTRIESELEAAKKIQTHYVPETPDIPDMAIHGVCLPAREIGGDYLDYFQNENGDWEIWAKRQCRPSGDSAVPCVLAPLFPVLAVQGCSNRGFLDTPLHASHNSLLNINLQSRMGVQSRLDSDWTALEMSKSLRNYVGKRRIDELSGL